MRARLLRIAGRFVLSLVLAAVLAAIALLIVIPRAVHGTALTVLTGSMTPTIPVGSVVIERPVDAGTLHVGDIATYQVAPGKALYITHRIVKIDTSKSPTVFTFKGDANRAADITPVPAGAIRGRVWFHVPHLGSVRDALSTRGGIAGVAVIVLAGYALWQLAGSVRDRRAARARPTDAEDFATPAPLPAPDVDQELVVDQQLILATLPIASFDGLSVDVISRLLGGTLLDVDDETFTVVMTKAAARADGTISLLQSFAPIFLERMTTGAQAVSVDA